MLKTTLVIIFASVILLGPTTAIYAGSAGVSGNGSIQISADSQFGVFIKWLFPALLVTCAILAVFMIIVAGFQWVTAYGNPSRIEDARDRIYMAILGLILAFASWLILNTINPALVELKFFGG